MIGILGGFGATGREVARLLALRGETALRLGGRHPQPASGGIQSQQVDIRDPSSLRRFAQGCRLIIHCAAPSAELSPLVARTLAAAGIPLVDAGGVDCPQQWDRSQRGPDTRALFAAGALPGLSGILPQWLASTMTRVDSLQSWFGIADRFTPGGAADYLDGVLNAAPTRVSLRRQSGVRLPFFPRPLHLQPFDDEETRLVASRLGLRSSRSWLALEGEALTQALERARSLTREEAVRAVVAGSALDNAGLPPRVTFLLQMDGERSGHPATRTLLLSAPGIATLTAASAVTAALWLLQNPAPVTGLMAACVDPLAFMMLFHTLDSGITLELFEQSANALMEMAGGEL